jgi:hypothetical protein
VIFTKVWQLPLCDSSELIHKLLDFIENASLARPLHNDCYTMFEEGHMFDQSHFASKSGAAALVSIAAMIAFNLYALSLQTGTADLVLAAVPMVELA